MLNEMPEVVEATLPKAPVEKWYPLIDIFGNTVALMWKNDEKKGALLYMLYVNEERPN